MKSDRRIAAVFTACVLDSTPCLYNLIQALADAGHGLDVYTSVDESFTAPQFRGDVRLFPHRGPRSQFISWFRPLMRRRRSEVAAVIAMDRKAVFATALSNRFLSRPPMVYFNLELYLPPIFRGWKHRIANRLEALILRRRSRMNLSPSRERAEYLTRWYGLEPDRMMVIPNSPPGNAMAARGDYLREKYGIDAGRPILLYFGSLTSANRIEELLAAAESWPEEFALVLHNRQQSGRAEHAMIESHSSRARCRIIHSASPLPLDELREMVCSADLGVALYPTEGAGFATMGTASGKIAQYLQSGAPVITSALPSLQSLFSKYPVAGICVASPTGILEAARGLLSKGAGAREAAARCFDAEFSFDRAFERFLPRFEALIGGQAATANARSALSG